MSDIVAFIGARLDDREAAARAAASDCGCHPPSPTWQFGDDENQEEGGGVSDADHCTCELLDVSTWAEERYIRGLNRGCSIHPQTEHDRRVVAEEDRRRAVVEAAKRAAREAPR